MKMVNWFDGVGVKFEVWCFIPNAGLSFPMSGLCFGMSELFFLSVQNRCIMFLVRNEEILISSKIVKHNHNC